MRKFEAKLLIMLNNMSMDLRYSEYIAAKLDKHASYVTSTLRRLYHQNKIDMKRYRTKVLVSSIQHTALEQATIIIEGDQVNKQTSGDQDNTTDKPSSV